MSGLGGTTLCGGLGGIELRGELVVDGELDRSGLSGGRYPEVALHFLVESRAEVGAVVGDDACAVGNPLQRAGLARHDEQLGVVGALNGESVWNVPFLFDVGHVEVNLITHIDALDVVGH